MGRKNLYEILSNMNFNAFNESNALLDLFKNEKQLYDGYYRKSLMQYIDNSFFRDMSIRGTYINIETMMTELQIFHPTSNLDDLFVLCEFLIHLFSYHKLFSRKANEQVEVILKNIDVIMDKTNHTLHKIGKNQFIVVKRNVASIETAEIVTDEHISNEIMRYNHFAIKGDLEEKRQILNNIGQYLEPILKSRKLGQAGYKEIESNMGFLLNNLHIRHNNKEGAKTQDYTKGLNNVELEEWYNKIYDLSLIVIMLNEHLPVQEEIKSLKKDYHWKT